MNGFFYFVSIFFRTTILIYREKPHVLFATWAYPDGFATVLLSKLFSLPIVIKVHGSDIHSVNTVCRRNMTSWALKRANTIISVSKNLANSMQKEFSVSHEKISVIQNGVNTNKFYPIDKQTALSRIGLNDEILKNIVFIGNLKPEKNPQTLLKAFRQFTEECTENVRLHFIGDGPLKKELELAINQQGLGNAVRMHSVLTHTEIPFWLNAADILVLPSFNEGMPNVVLEALACGTPVVASDVGGIPEIIEDGVTGFLFQPDNAEELAKKLEIALQKKWDKNIFAARSTDGTWEKTAQLLMENLRHLKSNC